jgi:hypothetical protein
MRVLYPSIGGNAVRYGELKAATLNKPLWPVLVLDDDLARLPAPDLTSSAHWDATQPYRPSDGFRSIYDQHEFGVLGIVGGYSDFVRLSDGFLMRILQATTSRTLSHTTCGDSWLRFQFLSRARRRQVGMVVRSRGSGDRSHHLLQAGFHR